MNKKLLQSVFNDDPDIQKKLADKEQHETLKEILKESLDDVEEVDVKYLRGKKGDKGDPADPPDPKKIASLVIEPVVELIKSDSEFVGSLREQVKNDADFVSTLKGQDGVTPVKGKDYFDGRHGETPTDEHLIDLIAPLIPKVEAIAPVHTTKIVKEALPLTPSLVAQIVTIMRTLPEKDRLDISQIRNASSFMKDGIKYRVEELMHGGGGSTGSTLVLQTNGTPNGSQSLLNLKNGTNVTITDDGVGGITINSTGGAGTPGGLNTQLQYNNSGVFGGITGATTDGTLVSLNAPHLLNPTINGAGTGLATLVYPNTAANATITVPATTGTLALTSQLGNLTVGTSTITSGTTTRILYDNAGVLGEYTLTGTGTVVAMQTSPNFLTSITGNTTSILTFPASATWQLGAADVASPVAQTLSVQSVVAGTSNTAGADFTLIPSLSTGSADGGKFVFKGAFRGGSGTAQNAASNWVTIGNYPTASLVPTMWFGQSSPSTTNWFLQQNSTSSSINIQTGGILGILVANGNNVAAFTTTVNSLGNAIQFGFSSTAGATTTVDTILTRKGAANFQFGAADAASPVAQTLSVQSVVAGTTDTAGVNWIHKASAGTGTGISGSHIFQVAPHSTTGSTQNAYATVLTLDDAKLATFAGAISVAGHVTFEGVTSTGATGTGLLVFGTSPILTAAILGSSTATTQAPADNSTKLATTAYVDAAVLGQNFKEATKYATTGVLATVVYNNGSSGVGATLTAAGLGAISIDGSTPSVGDRILVKNQVSTFQNGIYTVTIVGTAGTVFVLTRATDTNTTGEFRTGDSNFNTSGTVNTSTTWAYTGVDSPVIGTDAITYAQTAGQGTVTSGNGITVTGLSVAIDTSVTVDKTTAQTLTNKTLTGPIMTAPVLGTPASGVMTNVTGLPAAAVLAGSFGSGAFVMSSSLQVVTIELGAATDTTISRVSAGLLAVEGVNILSSNATGVQTFLTTPSSANFAAVITDETGSGKVVFDTAPVFSSTISVTKSIATGFTTTATAAGTTTMDITSTEIQYWTGSSTQTIKLPTTSVLAGARYTIVNQSTGSITVQSSGANTIVVLGAGMSAIFTAVVATPTTAANWDYLLNEYLGLNNAITASSNAATINLAYKTNTVTNNSAATLTITLPTAGAIDGETRIVRVLDSSAVAQTLTLVNTENSTVTPAATTNGSTTLPYTFGVQYNAGTSKWRVIASA